jgi:transcriptional regulator with XRE-family HTH domain
MEKALKYKVNFQKAIGKKIRFYRTSKGMSQEDLAVKCNNHRTQIARIEQGKRNCGIFTLKSICDILEIKLSDLFNEDFYSHKY